MYEESTRNVICIGSSFMHFSDRKSLFYLQNSFSIRKSQRLIVWKMHEIVYTSFQNQSTCTRRQNILHSIFSSSLNILLFINLDDLKRRIILVQANILSHTKIIEHQIFSAFKPYQILKSKNHLSVKMRSESRPSNLSTATFRGMLILIQHENINCEKNQYGTKRNLFTLKYAVKNELRLTILCK